MRSSCLLVYSLALACGQNATPTPPSLQAPGPPPIAPIAPIAQVAPVAAGAQVVSIQRPPDPHQCSLAPEKDACYLAQEAGVIAQLPGRATRAGMKLTLVLDDGRTVEKLSQRTNQSSDIYYLLDFRAGFFMIHVTHYEGGGWLAVNAATGDEHSWSFLLAFAPDARYLAVAPMKGDHEDDGLEALQVWQITGRGVATMVASVPPPCDVYSFEWQGAETILVHTDADACGGVRTTQVRLGAGGRWEGARPN